MTYLGWQVEPQRGKGISRGGEQFLNDIGVGRRLFGHLKNIHLATPPRPYKFPLLPEVIDYLPIFQDDNPMSRLTIDI